MDVITGLIVLAATLLVAAAAGLALRRNAGRFRLAAGATPTGATPTGATRELLTAADLGVPLGERATLVQFSTAFCAPCRPTRQILSQVAGLVDGVRHVEIDAAERLDLVGRLRIASTPTVLVLDRAGAVTRRASGLPRKADVIAAVGEAVDSGASPN
jgi:thiol-disulfide isomerase/thioredoxin